MAKDEQKTTIDLRKRVEVRRVSDGQIRLVGELVAAAGIKSGIYEDPATKPSKKSKEGV